MTTIKLDSTIRDRLAGVARARGQTMDGLLSTVAARTVRRAPQAEDPIPPAE